MDIESRRRMSLTVEIEKVGGSEVVRFVDRPPRRSPKPMNSGFVAKPLAWTSLMSPSEMAASQFPSPEAWEAVWWKPSVRRE